MTASTESMLKFNNFLSLGSVAKLLELLNGKDGAAIAKTKDSLGRYPLHRVVPLSHYSSAYKLISKLLSLCPEAIDTCDKDGRYVLHVASAKISLSGDGSSTEDVMLCLLKAKPEHASKHESSTKMLPLHYACQTQPDRVIKALVDAYPHALRVMDADGNLPAHLAVRNRRNNNLEYLYSQYPEAFMQKNKGGKFPIDCCAKDDEMFLHLARLCPKTLFHINEGNIPGSVLLSPLVDYLERTQYLPRCRADMMR